MGETKPPAGAMALWSNDPYANPYAGPLTPRDAVLLSRGGGRGAQGWRIYDEIERDPRAAAVLRKRRQAVLRREWVVDPADDSRAARKAAALVTGVLRNIDFDGACDALLGALLKGFAAGEVIWTTTPEGVFPIEIRPIEQRRIVFAPDWRPRLLTKAAPLDGEELPERKIIIHRVGDPHDPYGRGLGHQLFWPCYFKRRGLAAWLEFIDRYGAPLPVGKTPPGTPEAERNRLLEVLINLSRDGAAVIDDNQEVDFKQIAAAAGITNEDFIRYQDEEITIATLGETLTTSVGERGGSRAASETHNDVREDLCDADADAQSGTLNASLIRWIVDLNMPGAPYPALWRPQAERQEDLDAAEKRRADLRAAQAAAVTALKTAGYQPADGGADIAQQIAGAWVAAAPANPAAAAAAAFAKAAAIEDNDDRMAAALDTATAAYWDATIDGLRAAIAAAPDLRGASAGLTQFAAGLRADELTALIENGLLAAALGGAYEIAQGVDAGGQE